MSDPLPILYQQMADITKPICDAGCEQYRGSPNRCCEKKYCELARHFAKENYGVELRDTGNVIPFMGSQGCTAPPHLRPICTMHACPINYGPGLDAETMNRYWVMRNAIFAEAKTQNKMPQFITKEEL